MKYKSVKKMKLAEAWTECLKMWKWVSAHYEEFRYVSEAKKHWLEINGYNPIEVQSMCFFCHFSRYDWGCRNCPPTKIDKSFHCADTGYSWQFDPEAFYERINELYKVYQQNEK